jgi:hypothetical protein
MEVGFEEEQGGGGEDGKEAMVDDPGREEEGPAEC